MSSSSNDKYFIKSQDQCENHSSSSHSTYVISSLYTQSEDSDIQQAVYNRLHLDLLKQFVGKASITSTRNGNRILIKMISDIAKEIIFENIMSVIRREHFLLLPACCYQVLEDINEIVKKANEIHGAIVNLKVSNDTQIYINGNDKECSKARNYVLERLMEFINKDYFKFYSFKDRILSSFNEPELNQSKDLEYDQMIFNYCLTFMKSDVENILSENDCILIHNSSNYVLKSNCCYKLRRCNMLLDSLYYSVVSLEKLSSGEEKLTGETDESVNSKTNIKNSKIMKDRQFEKIKKEFIVIETSNNRNFIIGRFQGLLNCIDQEERYKCEINVDYPIGEFICGKKNGKINIIMRETACKIRMMKGKRYTEKERTNFDIEGKGGLLLSCISKIFDEFPIEEDFYVEKIHHKRIIGSCGKNIQSIMKKYDVYVKFLNDEGTNIKNVTMKTPRKNVKNLSKMKEEIIRLSGARNASGNLYKSSLFLPNWQEPCFIQSDCLNLKEKCEYYLINDQANEISNKVVLGTDKFLFLDERNQILKQNSNIKKVTKENWLSANEEIMKKKTTGNMFYDLFGFFTYEECTYKRTIFEI